MPDVDAALVFERAIEGPGTHVLLIGIGAYPHLIGGEAEDLDVAEGMGQLEAPPRSVDLLARWFLDGHFINPERPLASLSMVVSADAVARFEHKNVAGGGLDLPRGGIDDVVAAIRAWVGRASTHRESQIVFFFSGHGVFAGNSVLMCRDYGGVREDRFAGSLNFDAFCVSLQTKTPEYQLLVADACRTPDAITDMLTRQSVGRSPLSSSRLSDRGGAPARQSVHLATSTLAPSWGRVNGASIYTEALLRALAGGGAQADVGMWVGTDGLQNALGSYTARLAKNEGVEQEPDRIRAGRFKIHKPENVHVPLYVSCDPVDAWSFEFSVTAMSGLAVCGKADHDPDAFPARREIELTLPCDRYDVSAVFQADAQYSGGTGTIMVFPPEVPIVLSMQRRH